MALRLPAEPPAAFASRLARAELAFDRTALALHTRGLGGPPLELRFAGSFLVGGKVEEFAPLSPVPHVAWDGGPLTAWQESHSPP